MRHKLFVLFLSVLYDIGWIIGFCRGFLRGFYWYILKWKNKKNDRV